MEPDTKICLINEDDYEFFYASKSPFSQWHRCEFSDLSGVRFSSAEQYMMYQKAMLFGDRDSAKKILATDNQCDIKALGRKIKNFDEARWVANRETIVIAGNVLKFSQNRLLLDRLLATGSKFMVEASPYDNIWGIGMSRERAIITPVHLWGTNLLGKCLNQVRSRLAFQERMRQVPAASVSIH
jgi:ribA/ribD-fused uncharacterized protein